VSGRTRAPGEINGKSGNLNNALASVYQQFKNRLADIPATELVVVFDADMQPKRDFFVKVLDVMRDRDTALCLTPQVGADTRTCRQHVKRLLLRKSTVCVATTQRRLLLQLFLYLTCRAVLCRAVMSVANLRPSATCVPHLTSSIT
jgi:cellulose synthase/poly-beta-1,6-N-acetylglucosamine synthase-like glycosyltransferase